MGARAMTLPLTMIRTIIPSTALDVTISLILILSQTLILTLTLTLNEAHGAVPVWRGLHGNVSHRGVQGLLVA